MLTLLVKNVNFPAIQFGYIGQIVNNKKSHVRVQSDGGWSNHLVVFMKKHAKS